MAYASSGDRSAAIAIAKDGLAVAHAQNDTAMTGRIEAWLAQYGGDAR
jgi:hypothetical protein